MLPVACVAGDCDAMFPCLIHLGGLLLVERTELVEDGVDEPAADQVGLARNISRVYGVRDGERSGHVVL